MKLFVRLLVSAVLLTQGLLGLVPRVHAAVSNSVVIYQLQTAGAASGTASQELVVLLNTSNSDVNVTNWCVQYSSSADSPGFKKCITPPDVHTELWLLSGGLVSFATSEFLSANPGFVADVSFSAGIAASGGHVRLFDANNMEIDKLGWGTATSPEVASASVHTVGKLLGRTAIPVVDTDNNNVDFSSTNKLLTYMSGLYEVALPIDVCDNIDGIQEVLPDQYMFDDDMACFLDVCLNLDDLQKSIPNGYEMDSGICTLVPLENRSILITELYPNAPSYDTGQEFIELYNPHNESISLKGYTLQVGPDFSDDFVFGDITIPANSYKTFSDTTTSVILPNSNGVEVRLRTPAGTLVANTPIYPELADTSSWAVVDDEWIVTNQVTPSAANKPFVQAADDEVLGVTTVLAPCPAGKYRNPQTNRCRTIETAVSNLTPCDEDEFRNPETNRCKKVASAVSALTPCDPGEERNPETNRCRKKSTIEAATIDEVAQVTDVAVESTSGQFNWPIAAGLLALTAGYMLFEWRHEIRSKIKNRP